MRCVVDLVINETHVALLFETLQKCPCRYVVTLVRPYSLVFWKYLYL